MVEGVTQRRHSPVTPQDALEDALAILGPQDVALQFEGLVAVEARAVADSTRVLSRLPRKRVKPHRDFRTGLPDAGTGSS